VEAQTRPRGAPPADGRSRRVQPKRHTGAPRRGAPAPASPTRTRRPRRPWYPPGPERWRRCLWARPRGRPRPPLEFRQHPSCDERPEGTGTPGAAHRAYRNDAASLPTLASAATPESGISRISSRPAAASSPRQNTTGTSTIPASVRTSITCTASRPYRMPKRGTQTAPIPAPKPSSRAMGPATAGSASALVPSSFRHSPDYLAADSPTPISPGARPDA